MYTDFYNLKEKPFILSPSSRFLYLGEIHNEALALLTYGVAERKGFTLLTGEVGAGKTTMIHALLEKLGNNTRCVHLSNPLLSSDDFMNYLASSVFDNKTVFKSKIEFLIEFESFLKKCLQHQRNVILIIDEAHKLSFELLEEIRLLSNMETADEKLLNIFLVGQPELNENLRQPQCRALLQRINTRYHIQPMDLQGTQEYIIKRLEMAGAKNRHKIFSKNVIKAIHQFSEGYPRMINILADNALLLGYARGTRKILPSMVRESYEDLRPEGVTQKSPLPQPEMLKVKKQKDININNHWKWASALLFLIVVSIITTTWYEEHQLSASASTLAKERILAKDNIEKIIQKKAAIQGQASANESAKRTPNHLDATSQEHSKDTNPLQSKEDEEPQKAIITVKEGETLIELATDVYGRSNEKILDMLQKHNPGIKNINDIAVGQEILFPQLSTSGKGPTYTVHIASCKPFENARKLFLNLIEQNHEAYIFPVHDTRKGKFFRITLGNFETQQEAKNYAKEILMNSISEYAQVTQLEMR